MPINFLLKLKPRIKGPSWYPQAPIASDKNVFFENIEKGIKLTKKVENGWKKFVLPAFGCAQNPKAGQNTQHTTNKEKVGKWGGNEANIS